MPSSSLSCLSLQRQMSSRLCSFLLNTEGDLIGGLEVDDVEVVVLRHELLGISHSEMGVHRCSGTLSVVCFLHTGAANACDDNKMPQSPRMSILRRVF